MIDIRIPTLDEIEYLNSQAQSDINVMQTDFTQIRQPSSYKPFTQHSDSYFITVAGELRIKDVSKMTVAEKAISGIRPVIKYSQIKDYCTYIKTNGTIKHVHFGQYPQLVVGKALAKTLDKALDNGRLHTTTKTYSTPHSNELTAVEYEHLGQKYIRLNTKDYPNNNYNLFDYYKLSDTTRLRNGNNNYWIRVKPIEWVVDEEQDIAISSNILMAGIPVGNKEYDKSNIKTFLEESFINEIVPSHVLLNTKVQKEDKNTKEEKHEGPRAKKKDNVYDFTLERVDEEDIIRGCIKGDIPVFLHGESSEGKSARVKQIDSDCVILYLSNATPESLNGKSVYDPNKGEIVDMPPSWYVKLKKKCEEEPDKIHVLFFDELTNALPSIQGMAFNTTSYDIFFIHSF